jgi:ABC-2 type transport system ATP-binding protein
MGLFMQVAVSVKKLSKTFLSKTNALKEPVVALNNLSFKIHRGEKVALIGPNGAGKSTTIKTLAGILLPSAGEVKVLGMTPGKDQNILGYKIGTLFGQRSQLWYHLQPLDSFALLSKIYEIPPKEYVKHLEELIHLFEIVPFLQKPVSSLSLGQRMRCELVASLLHKPEILFLDEPTIGLDIEAKAKVRALLNTLAKLHGTTIILSSHDTADIEQVCSRVLVLDKGSLLIDSPLKELKNTYNSKKDLSLLMEGKNLSLDLPGVQVLKNDDHQFRCKVDTKVTSIEQVLQKALNQTTLKDLSLNDLSMDEIVKILYGKKRNV